MWYMYCIKFCDNKTELAGLHHLKSKFRGLFITKNKRYSKINPMKSLIVLFQIIKHSLFQGYFRVIYIYIRV